MAITEKWHSEQYYHIYNRGNNHSDIFYSEENYTFFLTKLSEYLLNYVEIFAYALIPNHFHFLIKIKSQESITDRYLKIYPGRKNGTLENKEIVNKIIGQAFSNMFNSYTKSINKQENRTGGLFESKCQRKLIKTDVYLNALIAYIHYNPIKHNLVNSTLTSEVSKTWEVYTEYKYSSFNAILSDKPTKLARNAVLEIYNGKDGFIDFHNEYSIYRDEKKIADLLFD